jgi:hypothetical protein
MIDQHVRVIELTQDTVEIKEEKVNFEFQPELNYNDDVKE